MNNIFEKIYDKSHLARNAYIISILFLILFVGLMYLFGLDLSEGSIAPIATRNAYLKIYNILVMIYSALMLVFIVKSFVEKFFLRSIFYPFLVLFACLVFAWEFAGVAAALWGVGFLIMGIFYLGMPIALILGIVLDIREFLKFKNKK